MPAKKRLLNTSCCHSIPRFITLFFLCFISNNLFAQETEDASLISIKDFGDLIKSIRNKKTDTTKKTRQKQVSILPSFGYNPSYGFVIGAKLASIKNLGKNDQTDLSSFGIEALYSTKGILTGQVRHNIFSPYNKWNIQGNWQVSNFLITDYGIGTGNKNYRTKSDSAFPIRFLYLRFMEKIYRKIAPNLFAGVGVSFDIRAQINDTKLKFLSSTPHKRYSESNGFNPERYTANGLLFALQYNTREHPFRSYGGYYVDLNLRLNQTWLGSTKNSLQLIYDIRKYWSLSKKNPEHVIAFWHLASYRLSGTIPYLSLPATGYDTYGRSGRGYTIGRFKGLSIAYLETEWRFPITRNKLLSGVAFVHFQTASDGKGKQLFQYIEPGAGGGLRILMQKGSRSTLCIDYAIGKYGSNGFFFGLNEAF